MYNGSKKTDNKAPHRTNNTKILTAATAIEVSFLILFKLLSWEL